MKTLGSRVSRSPWVAATLLSAALICGAQAQTAPTTTGDGVADRAQQALTLSEQTAVAQMLDTVGKFSGQALLSEVGRLSKLYADQNFNLPAIVRAVKTGSGNKLGAVTAALDMACKGAPSGSFQRASICDAVLVLPSDLTDVETAAIDTAGLQTAATGGGGAGLTANGVTDNGNRSSSGVSGNQSGPTDTVSRRSGSTSSTTTTNSTTIVNLTTITTPTSVSPTTP